MQAVAVKVNVGRVITCCNVYIAGSHEFSRQLMTDLTQQLPRPFVLMGDFNSYHELWGCEERNIRGRILEEFLTDYSYHVLNNGAPTHISHGRDTAIDLTICTPELTALLDWTIMSSPGDSDHCPIVVTYLGHCGNATDTNIKYWQRLELQESELG